MASKTRPRKGGYEGLQTKVRSIPLPRIAVWKNRYPDRDSVVSMEIPEFTCVCPKTGLPDFAVLRLRYVPDLLCVELKSLKEYMNAFRDLGFFHEHAVNRILDDLEAACRPRAMVLEGVFNPRGGITTTVSGSRGDPAKFSLSA